MRIRKRFLEIIETIDTNLRIYLSVLVLSWVVIIIYLLTIKKEESMENQLETYPYEHSKITDSTLNARTNGN